ncbi:MAG: helix-turn-helix domain-containing protein [Gammaproteobacteria bacterium]|nr:helix-turn-helix domain-containing protein [Gammaproteobacteria bacterium]
MNSTKRNKLEAKGWKLGDAQDFLALSDEEMAFIEMKLALSRELKARRLHKHLSQAGFARRINSSQSRVAKMEAGDASVSMDLLIRSLLALGASRKELARFIEQSKRRVA